VRDKEGPDALGVRTDAEAALPGDAVTTCAVVPALIALPVVPVAVPVLPEVVPVLGVVGVVVVVVPQAANSRTSVRGRAT